MLEKFIRNGTFIEVNTSEVRNERAYPFLVSVFVKFDAMHEESGKVEAFLEFKERLIEALEERAHFVGMRVEDGWSEFYFYAEDSKGIQPKVASVFSGSGYVYESSITKDAKWDFYYENLFPSDLEFYLIYSKKIILQMIAEGDDLTVPREVEHYVSFDTKSQKERFVKEVETIGFTYKGDVDAKELEHAVAITKVHALDQDTLTRVIGELLEYIKKDHGYYELWSAPLADA